MEVAEHNLLLELLVDGVKQVVKPVLEQTCG